MGVSTFPVSRTVCDAPSQEECRTIAEESKSASRSSWLFLMFQRRRSVEKMSRVRFHSLYISHFGVATIRPRPVSGRTRDTRQISIRIVCVSVTIIVSLCYCHIQELMRQKLTLREYTTAATCLQAPSSKVISNAYVLVLSYKSIFKSLINSVSGLSSFFSTSNYSDPIVAKIPLKIIIINKYPINSNPSDSIF